LGVFAGSAEWSRRSFGNSGLDFPAVVITADSESAAKEGLVIIHEAGTHPLNPELFKE
jgi:hypothetical protein